MADFCWECVKELGVPPEKNDFKGIVPPGETAQVLCEGCGVICVDHLGKRTGKLIEPEEKADADSQV